MIFTGQILKMASQLAQPIQYYLNLSGDLLSINQMIGKNLKIKHIGYQCVECGDNQPIFRMGFCKKCFFESPYASETILKPELSKAHLGIEERNLAVEQQIQLQPHIVYLAYTGDVKVGVTRESQVPIRWIDQGASFALPIARTPNRYEAGVIEVALKQHLADKTNWRKMLQDEKNTTVDLESVRQQILSFIPNDSQSFILEKEEIYTLQYPYTAPEKIIAFTLDKNPDYQGILSGIKGQYLCFTDGSVINLRSHEGYVVELIVS